MTMENEFQPDVDEVEADASDATEDSTDAADEAATDPLEDLRAQVGTAATKAELESLRSQIRSELGRSQKLEARLDALAGANPLADVDPRLDANEALLTSIADALTNSDLTDDRDKAALRASLSALVSAKGARAQGRMREELKAEILGALPGNTAVTDDSNPWAVATQDVLAEIADTLPGFDANSIPSTVWAEGRAKGTPTRAAAHVLRWAQQQAVEPAATRTATRRQAAGAGSPARQGAASTDYATFAEAEQAWLDGDLSDEKYATARERFKVRV